MCPVIIRLFNALVKALNSSPYLPDAIVMIVDKDIIESINRFDYGIRDIIELNIHWLIKQMARAIIGCRESLKKIRPGVAPVELPRIVWLLMLARPFTSDQYFRNIWSQRAKFNTSL